jgi:hypothetical protein
MSKAAHRLVTEKEINTSGDLKCTITSNTINLIMGLCVAVTSL